MYDVHSHILWNIDDGVETLEQAKSICKISNAQGVKYIFATPHYILEEAEQKKEHVIEKVNILNEFCEEEGLKVRVLIGSECYINPLIPNYIEENKLITLNNSKYLLVEFPMDCEPNYINDILYRIMLKGVIPVIAHVERYSYIRKHPNTIYDFIEKGYVIQCNAGSFLGLFGSNIKHFAVSLLKHNMVHVIGSDAHTDNIDRRGPCMDKAIEAIKELNMGVDVSLFSKNAELISQNKEILYSQVRRFSSNLENKKTNHNKKGLFSKISSIFKVNNAVQSKNH